jgi:hypothetical protein
MLGEDHEDLRRSVRELARREQLDGYLERALQHDDPRTELRRLAGAGLVGMLVDGSRGS